jgi:hypothetical protein
MTEYKLVSLQAVWFPQLFRVGQDAGNVAGAHLNLGSSKGLKVLLRSA